MKIFKKMSIFLLIILPLGLLLFLFSGGFFKDFGDKLHYSGYSYKATAKEMDVINENSIKKSAENKSPITIIIHGAAAEYYSDVFGTVLWFKENGYNAVSFDYDYKANPIESAEKLSFFVQEILEQTGTKKLNIYGICLGGIIARYYAEKFNGARYVDKLVTVVSPVVPIPRNKPAYLYDKYFSFDPEPWNGVMEELNGKNPVSKYLYIYCKKDWIVPAKYQHASFGNFLGLNCGHTFVNVNPEILKSASAFFEKNDL